MSKRTAKDDIAVFHEYGVYLPNRTIYMGSEEHDIKEGESGTDGAMAQRLIKNLHVLEAISSEPITIIMNNIGGDEYHCFAMYDAIRECKSHVTIVVKGHAMSAGSIILQAADKRVMSLTSRQMIHYGTWGTYDHAKTAQKHAQEGKRIDEWMEHMYLRRIREKKPAFSLAKLRTMLDHDTYLTAHQSVELGLADEVLEPAVKDE